MLQLNLHSELCIWRDFRLLLCDCEWLVQQNAAGNIPVQSTNKVLCKLNEICSLLEDERLVKITEVLSFTERALLHWCEEAVRTWDEHAISAVVSSPIEHKVRILSLLQCFQQYNTGWGCYLCSSVFINRTEDEDAISAVMFLPIEHKVRILSLLQCSHQ